MAINLLAQGQSIKDVTKHQYAKFRCPPETEWIVKIPAKSQPNDQVIYTFDDVVLNAVWKANESTAHESVQRENHLMDIRLKTLTEHTKKLVDKWFCRLSACVKGYLTRRLLRTETVQKLIREYENSKQCTYAKCRRSASLEQLAILSDIHYIFFEMDIRRQMKLIAVSRWMSKTSYNTSGVIVNIKDRIPKCKKSLRPLSASGVNTDLSKRNLSLWPVKQSTSVQTTKIKQKNSRQMDGLEAKREKCSRPLNINFCLNTLEKYPVTPATPTKASKYNRNDRTEQSICYVLGGIKRPYLPLIRNLGTRASNTASLQGSEFLDNTTPTHNKISIEANQSSNYKLRQNGLPFIDMAVS